MLQLNSQTFYDKKAIVLLRLLHTGVFAWISSHLQQHDACHDSYRCGEVSFLPKLQSLSLSQPLCSLFPLIHYCITRGLSTLFANSRFIVGTTYEHLQQNANWTKFKKEKRHVTTVMSTVISQAKVAPLALSVRPLLRNAPTRRGRRAQMNNARAELIQVLLSFWYGTWHAKKHL